MKAKLYTALLLRLATWLSGSKPVIVAHLQEAIKAAEAEFPKAEGNTHQARRLNWVRDRAKVFLSDKAAWAVNVVIEMLVAYARLKGGV